jgi:hypothetical protein
MAIMIVENKTEIGCQYTQNHRCRETENLSQAISPLRQLLVECWGMAALSTESPAITPNYSDQTLRHFANGL